MAEWSDDKVDAIIRRVTREFIIKHLEGLSFDVDNTVAFVRGLLAESDVTLSIVFFSFIDAKLVDLLRGLVSTEIPGAQDGLFGGIGPLSSAHNRILVA